MVSESLGRGRFRQIRYWQGIRRRLRVVDLLLLLLIPAVSVGVFALPEATRQSLVFEYLRPTVLTGFTAAFVHFDQWHLWFNLVGYALVVSTLYALAAASGRRRRFGVVVVALVVACPVPLAYLNFAVDVVPGGASYGFSGVVMALYGYLPLSLATYLESELDVGRARTFAPLLFFVGVAIVTLLTLLAILTNPVRVAVDGVPTSVNWVLAATLAGLVPALGLVVLRYVLEVTDDPRDVRSRLTAAVERTGRFELAVLAAVLYVGFPFVMFPVTPTSGTTVVNLLVHFLGFALGFIASFLYSHV